MLKRRQTEKTIISPTMLAVSHSATLGVPNKRRIVAAAIIGATARIDSWIRNASMPETDVSFLKTLKF
jgi:hypothetical protein